MQGQLPGVLQSLTPVLNHYGYLAVAGLVMLEDFGIPVPGETTLIAAAVYAGAGKLNIAVVVIVGILAAIIGDNIGYVIGRFGGHALVIRFGKYIFITEERLNKTEQFFNRHGGKVVTIARFVEGLRQANGIVAGITEMPWPKFVLFNALGAFLWVGFWSSVGFFAGNNITPIYNAITHYSIIVGIIAVIVLLAVFLFHRKVRGKSKKSSESTQNI